MKLYQSANCDKNNIYPDIIAIISNNCCYLTDSYMPQIILSSWKTSTTIKKKKNCAWEGFICVSANDKRS